MHPGGTANFAVVLRGRIDWLGQVMKSKRWRLRVSTLMAAVAIVALLCTWQMMRRRARDFRRVADNHAHRVKTFRIMERYHLGVMKRAEEFSAEELPSVFRDEVKQRASEARFE